jgi:TolB-like protein/Tfp pilus assembly protein PilF
MFTDMVGYTALMQQDELLAKQNRDRHRKILQNSVSKHRGEILQYYGDGTLCIFNSAIEGVECATEIQMDLQKDPKIPLRIGIHTGDIVYDDEGVYGDGVNVASRIEGLAVSGSILISGKVCDEVKNHQSILTEYLGTFDLKNVNKPLEVYAIANEGLIIPNENEINTKPRDLLKSLAVLPFVNMSADPENEYFSDGITEELLNLLAREDGFRVTARTSSFAYKGRNEDIKQIGAQLGANYILEGSVRKAGNRIRITAQLISTVDGYHIWSDTYNRLLEDIFEVQDEIAHKITYRLREKLNLKDEKAKTVIARTTNMEAYNVYLKGLYHANKWTLKDAEIAIEALHTAIEMEPGFSLPYSRLSYIYIYLGTTGKKPIQEVFPKAKEYALKALQFDEHAAESHEALARVYFFHEWKWNEAWRSLERAIELNPNYAEAYVSKAGWLTVHERTDEAIQVMRMSIQLDPFNPPGIFYYSWILMMAGRFKESLDQLDKLFNISTSFPDALALKGIVYQQMGDYGKALDIFSEVQKIPGFRAESYGCLGGVYIDMNQPEKANEYLEKLLAAEKKAYHRNIAFHIATIYAKMDKPDEMYHYLNRSYENGENRLPFLRWYPPFRRYHRDPSFAEIVNKLGLSN